MESVLDLVLGHFNYWAVIALLMIGLYGIIARQNLLKKLACLSIFQTGVFLLFISWGYRHDATVPILAEGFSRYANPLPQVLMLTAIVVGVATLAVGYALIVRIHKAYGSIEEDAILEKDQQEQE
ncbi:cation:proton antiporter subunit C [Aliiglaciecola sp. CAU 1673]|uniref:cation:proton antiporter subunit C n=1 Tax=Aliiglaciecola sp. CAU 1673 TaxID=3032595 RepID=UPI0023DADB8A|nr:cation:proton antiporter subunit C [Aliiglaciecola sp. CAU 1673]MDF2179844.1 cation:proton antiporter subunit C [Aliiglaciecola sp. CAU 1673]